MHGLRQGSLQLQDLCKANDIVYIQEHWLAPYKLRDLQDICPDMFCLMSSAMTDVISTGVLKGRPFGGVGILVNNKVATDVKLKFASERYVIVELHDLVFVNVYLHFIVSKCLVDNIDHYAVADSGIYYHTSMKLLNDIKIPWHLLTDDCLNKQDVLYFIDSFYTDIHVVTAFQTSSDSTVPKHKSNFYKYWWDQEPDLLKQESVKNHRIWSALGRPRYGSCFEEMRKSKLRYKQAIKKKEKEGTQHFSDSLADALLYKDMNSFWKSWRSKMGGGRTSDIIDQHRRPQDIACLPNSSVRHEELKTGFISFLSNICVLCFLTLL